MQSGSSAWSNVLYALPGVLRAGEAAGLPCCASGEKESLHVHIAAFGTWDPWLESVIFKVISSLSDSMTLQSIPVSP